MENKTLCNNNLEVQSNLKELKKLLKSARFNPEIIELINNSLQILRTMKKQGQKIENRCRKYRNSIEALGFHRNKY